MPIGERETSFFSIYQLFIRGDVMNSTQASATIFGFQFQINAAIYLMLKHFSDFDQIKIEGSQEDIELFLHDNKKILKR